jgi:hypothetical protein
VSHRPVLKKRANKLRKVLRAELPAYIDLVEYLKTRGHAQTTGEAEKIILAGRVRSESHKLGITQQEQPKRHARIKARVGLLLTADDYETTDVVQRRVPAKLRDTIQVLPA